MENQKPLHLLSESCGALWAIRKTAYKRVFIFFTKKQKILATLHFDVQDDGIFIPRKPLCKILGLKPKAISNMLGRMDRVASYSSQELWDRKYLGV